MSPWLRIWIVASVAAWMIGFWWLTTLEKPAMDPLFQPGEEWCQGHGVVHTPDDFAGKSVDEMTDEELRILRAMRAAEEAAPPGVPRSMISYPANLEACQRYWLQGWDNWFFAHGRYAWPIIFAPALLAAFLAGVIWIVNGFRPSKAPPAA